MKPAVLFTIMLATVLAAGCKKERTETLPGPEKKDTRLAIKLNSYYMTANDIDSAVVLWEINDQVQQETMQVSQDALFMELKKLSEGDGRLTVQIFSKIQLRQRKLQWEKRFDHTLKHSESMNLAAPQNLDDQAWFPRVIMIDAPTAFTAIVALRAADPYFLLKNVPVGYKIELERNYVATPGGAVIVGGGLWRCNMVCTDERGIIENRDYFTSLPAQIRDREWKMVEIGIGLFGSGYTSGPGFYFNHY